MKRIFLCGTVMVSLCPVASYASSRYQGELELAPMHVESFVTPPGTTATAEAMVSLRGAGVGSLIEGDLLMVERDVIDHSAGRVQFATGKLKVKSVDGARALAKIDTDGIPESAVVLGRYNKIMAGDFVRYAIAGIEPSIVITPQVTMEYNSLFADPNAGSPLIELTQEGRDLIKKEVEKIGSVRASLLAVEGYTDRLGDAAANQVESYERALAVRRYLVEVLGFDGERVRAFGMGEQEMTDTSNLPGSVEHNRRIVVKIIQQKVW